MEWMLKSFQLEQEVHPKRKPACLVIWLIGQSKDYSKLPCNDLWDKISKYHSMAKHVVEQNFDRVAPLVPFSFHRSVFVSVMISRVTHGVDFVPDFTKLVAPIHNFMVSKIFLLVLTEYPAHVLSDIWENFWNLISLFFYV